MELGVYKSINAVQAELANIGVSKQQTNSFDNYKFRGIDDIYNALAPLLAKNKLCILPRLLERTVKEGISDKGKTMYYVDVLMEFDLVSSEDASKHTVCVAGEAMDRSDKATNKAMSAAYKYMCFQTFCIPTEGDNDADASTPEMEAVKPTQSDDDDKKPWFSQADFDKYKGALKQAFDSGERTPQEAVINLRKTFNVNKKFASDIEALADG